MTPSARQKELVLIDAASTATRETAPCLLSKLESAENDPMTRTSAAEALLRSEDFHDTTVETVLRLVRESIENEDERLACVLIVTVVPALRSPEDVEALVGLAEDILRSGDPTTLHLRVTAAAVASAGVALTGMSDGVRLPQTENESRTRKWRSVRAVDGGIVCRDLPGIALTLGGFGLGPASDLALGGEGFSQVSTPNAEPGSQRPAGWGLG